MPLSDWMYDKLPATTRYRDQRSVEGTEKKPPLRQLIDVLGAGLEVVKQDVDSLGDLTVVEDCPDELLPYLGGLYGFEFPYDLSVEKQRGFLKNVIPLAMAKGTPWSIRLSALRVIGAGFDLTIRDEDYRSKTYTVEVTAEGSGETSQLEQKLSYMVHQYSPAGMVPNIVIVYYFAEETELTERVDDSDHESFVTTAWRTNFAGHRLSDNMQASGFGTTPLNI